MEHQPKCLCYRQFVLKYSYICRMAASEAPDASYTVFIRLPFPRGNFVDPPAVGRIPYLLVGADSLGRLGRDKGRNIMEDTIQGFEKQ
jgi:hypothetical protein